MKRLVLFILAFNLFASIHAQELSLDEAIKIGLENNFSIKIEKNNEEIAQNNNSLGNAGFLPVVSATGSQNYTRQNAEQLFSFDPDSTRTSKAKSDVLSAGVSLSWTIFDGAKMFASRERLNELEINSGMTLEKTIENTILNISLAYYKIILERNKYNVLDSSLALSEDRLNIAKSKYEVGNASKLEFMSAQVDYNTDLSALLRQEETLVEAKIELNRLLNRGLESPFDILGDIEIDTTMVMETLTQDALNNNVDLKILRSNMAVSAFNLREIRAEKFPTLAFNMGYNYNNLNSESGILLANKTNGVSYGLTASWFIFNGFNVSRRTQNAKIAINSSQLMLDDLSLQIQAQVLRTFKSYKNNLRLLRLEQENLDVAQENALIALERYKLGNSNALELREAQVQSVQASSRLLDSSYNTKIAELNLWLISGRFVRESN